MVLNKSGTWVSLASLDPGLASVFGVPERYIDSIWALVQELQAAYIALTMVPVVWQRNIIRVEWLSYQ